jgi:hypothetical protein
MSPVPVVVSPNPLEPQKTFAQLAASDVGDEIQSDDDIPLSETIASGLGKRERTSSPLKDLPTDEGTRANRRMVCVIHEDVLNLDLRCID